MVSFATVSGVVGVFVSAGAAFMPAMAGFIYDTSKSYRISFTIFAAMSPLSAGVIYFANPPPQKRTNQYLIHEQRFHTSTFF